MGKRGNGADEPSGSQPSLDLDQDPQSAERETAEHAGEEENPVTELINTNEGCWKVLADGSRVELTDSEWRKELTRLLASPPPAP